MIVEIKLENGGKIPQKGESKAMCYDCYVNTIEKLDNGKIVVGLGFSAKPPKGYGIRLIPRSNLTKHFWVMNNSIGIGDEDYKGEYKAVFTPLISEDYTGNLIMPKSFPYIIGDRCCQMEIYKREDFEFKEVEKLSGEDRGGGFGSTGLN